MSCRNAEDCPHYWDYQTQECLYCGELMVIEDIQPAIRPELVVQSTETNVVPEDCPF